MTELQSMLLDMFKWFHKLCQDEGLTYYAVGGTALGAARHHGFIPWDDDIDVAMPREEYNKLKKCATKYNVFDSKYFIEFPGMYTDYEYPFCKIYDKETTLIENKRKKALRGIYIDVFPLDGIGNSLDESIKNYNSVNTKINFLNTRICEIRAGRNKYKNLAIYLSRCIPAWVCNTQKLINSINLTAEKIEYSKSRYVVNWFGNWKEKEISEKAWFGTPVLTDFEDTRIYCPENLDSYLTKIYGDYEKLPPKEKRVSHHDYIKLDLNESYYKK